ncbi:PREDICTED: paralemmin-3 [Chinchilla lanigera]|uniref:paralemmin-3 n=1 Tax=Chinchilla lanigera TaxID=34839 RepID=UPI00038ED39A|nr:PREDICTED: paralemmin-3 [Chinchilla lanigera]
MALQSQAWAPATPMPVAESSLYRQRLEVIAEKRRLQEQIRTARRELEEEKLRVQRLKRKSLRERWLMDGAAEGQDQPPDPAAQDPQSPEGQAQARIRHLEDSLFTLQSQLQLLQSASTGAQHRPPGRPSWRRQGHRPLSQPIMEAGPAGRVDVDRRASLPVGPMGLSPELHSEPVEGAPTQVSGAEGSPQEANGPCSGPSPPPEQGQSLGTGTTAEGGVVKAKGGDVVEVVWEGLRGPQDCAMGATGLELEARVEQVVLEAIADRQGPGGPELPAWVREDRGVVEVVWEGLGGSDPEAPEEVGSGERGLRERLGGVGSTDREPDRQGRPEGDEGSFIWVERVTVSEDWEELLMEGLEGPLAAGREAVKGPPGTDGGGGGDPWAAEKRRAEGPVGAGETGTEERQGTERDGAEGPLERVQQEGSAARAELEGTAGEQEEGAERDMGVQREGVEGPLRAERGRSGETPGAETEAPLGAEERGEGRAAENAEAPAGPGTAGEEGSLGAGGGGAGERGAAGTEGEEPAGTEEEGGKEEPGAAGELVVTQGTAGEELLGAEGTAGEELLGAEGTEPVGTEGTGGEEPLGAEGTPGARDLQDGTEQREAGEGRESQAEAGSEAGAPLGVAQELAPELQPPEKQEGSPKEDEGAPKPPAEAQGPPGNATPLLAETPAPDQPTESQPLLPREGPSTNPSAHPAPTYAPTRQPEPTPQAEGEEASGPKQKTCQCCAVM